MGAAKSVAVRKTAALDAYADIVPLNSRSVPVLD
jgi:hypothetical protein